MASSPSLTLKRRLKAPPQKVYEAWTQPEQIARWWGNTGSDRTPIAELDLRVGGRFRVQFWSPNGEHHSVSGTYREVIAGRRLVFSWAWQSTPERESQVTVEFKADGAETLLTLTHEKFFNEQAAADHGRGWNRSFDALEAMFP
jgi:uncharacterized protein YndB with AHSA1/START domain